MTQKMNRTPWYHGSVKPERPGVYERKTPYGAYVVFSAWTGSVWTLWKPSPELAKLESGKSFYQTLPWRGLTAPANVKEAK